VDIYIADTAVGYGTGCTVGISSEIIKAYFIGTDGDMPAILEDGNKSFPFTIDFLYIDNTYATLVEAGTATDIEVHPAGSGGGGGFYKINDAIFTSWEMTVTQDGIVLENVAGEGKSLTLPV
jgi:hypothetical protein